MTMLDERRRATATPAREIPAVIDHTLEWVFGAIGALAALIGGWMYYGPSEGVLRLLGWDWNVSDLAEAWPFSLMIGGGAVLAAALGTFAYRMFRRDGRITAAVTIGTLLAVAALTGAVIYLIIWIV